MNGRVPPHSIESEMAVLGSMLLGDRGALERAMEAVTREDFYRDAHAHLFDAMYTLNGRGEPVDIITLKNELQGRGILDQVGGLSYLMQLGDVEFTTANVSYYAKIVSEKAILRRLLEAASQIAALGYTEGESVGEAVDRAEKIVFEVARKRDTQGFAPLRTLLNDVFENVDTVYRDRGVVTGVDTGYNDLNYMTSGLQEGDLFILAARPSMGKCLRDNSLIDDPATGERLTIREYVERQIPQVASVGECGEVRPAHISHWVDSGVKPCFRVMTRLGRSVEVTGHHPFLTADGWTPLHDLKVGKRIAVPASLSLFGNDTSWSADHAALAGYLLSFRRCSNDFARVTGWPKLREDYFRRLVSAFPGQKVEMSFGSVCFPDGATPYYGWLGAHCLNEPEEHRVLPPVVWTLPGAAFRELLRVLFSCDGTRDKGKHGVEIKMWTHSEVLAGQLQHALLRFGILSQAAERAPRYKKTRKARSLWGEPNADTWQRPELRTWRVLITEPESVERFEQQIGWVTEPWKAVAYDKAQRPQPIKQLPPEAWRAVRASAHARNRDVTTVAASLGETLPPSGWPSDVQGGLSREYMERYADALNDDHLRCLASRDLYWDEIVSIEPTGEHTVFDLTVPNGANFIANDICVHNTSLAMGIGQNACLKGKTVAVFSLEMSKPQLVQRMICSEARVDAHRVRTGYLNDDDWGRISEAVSRFWDANMFIDDSTEMSALEMRAKCRRLQAEHGLDLVIVDYLQLMRGGGKNESNRNEEITTIARGLKSLARELKVPVLALAQLSRAVERREDKRPMLSDLRDSGSIEAEADLVAFIYRPKYYERKDVVSSGEDGAGKSDGDGDDNMGEYGGGEEAEVIIAKHRNGPTGTVKLAFIPKFARFDNLAEHREDSPF